MLAEEEVLINEYIRRHPHSVALGRSYELLPGIMQFREGDLLLQDGQRLSAIEFKHIDRTCSGKTARTRRITAMRSDFRVSVSADSLTSFVECSSNQ